MKKLLALALALTFGFCVIGCEKPKEKKTEPKTPAATPDEKKAPETPAPAPIEEPKEGDAK